MLWKWAVSSTPARRSRAAAKNSRDLARVGHPGRVAEADLLAAGGGEPLGDLEDPLGRHLALVGAAEARWRSRPRSAAPPRAPRASVRSSPASDSSIERLTFLRLWVSEAERKTLISSKRSRSSSARSSPRSLGISTEKATPSRRSNAASTSSASASCGITSGRTNEVTSSRRRPGRREQVDQPHLVGGGDHLGLVLEAVAGPDLADPDAARQSSCSSA